LIYQRFVRALVYMHIQVIPNRGSPPAILLRESYREDGKVKKRTLLNLTDWPALRNDVARIEPAAWAHVDDQHFSAAVLGLHRGYGSRNSGQGEETDGEEVAHRRD
jgi:hypothetical protein